MGLTDEVVIRATTGKIIEPPKSLVLTVCAGATLLYHRVKFALAHGWLPEEVDHQDGNRQNNALSNLRAATRQQNVRNRGPVRRGDDLPRGVTARGKRFRAKIKADKKETHLGTFDTAEEASQVVEAKLKALHGDFYRDHNAHH